MSNIDLKRDCGAKGNDEANDTAALDALLTRCAETGEDGWVPAGRYRIDPLSHVLRADVRVRCSPQARFLYARPGQKRSLLTLRSNRRWGFEWFGGAFDPQGGTYENAKASNTGLSFIGVSRFLVDGTMFDGGSHWSAQSTDSGISFNNCGWGQILRCHFSGFADIGIYAGGGANAESEEDDGEGAYIQACRFDGCMVAASNKRRGNALHLTGNRVYRGRYGFLTQQVTGLPAGQRNHVIGNEFVDVTVAAVGLRQCEGAIVAENRIVDFGFEGGRLVNSQPMAVRLEGSRKCVVTANVIDQIVNPRHDATVGVLCADFTFEDRKYKSGENLITGNIISKDIGKPWLDVGSDASVYRSNFTAA